MHSKESKIFYGVDLKKGKLKIIITCFNKKKTDVIYAFFFNNFINQNSWFTFCHLSFFDINIH